jgi:hypothetical protein
VTPEEALAGGLKLLFALAVLRWPLPGAFLSILADGLDVVVMNYVDLAAAASATITPSTRRPTSSATSPS